MTDRYAYSNDVAGASIAAFKFVKSSCDDTATMCRPVHTRRPTFEGGTAVGYEVLRLTVNVASVLAAAVGSPLPASWR